MGIFSKSKPAAEPAGQELSSTADVERPALKSPPSAPAGTLADKDKQHSDQAHKEQHSSSSSEHVHRSRSDPTGAKQRPSALPQKDTLTVSQKATLAHVQMLSKVMDNAVTIPIINKKIGLDAMIGLIPYAGDMAGATVGTYIITRALKYNMPKRLVLRMMANQAIDTCVGVIPFIGDIFDFGFKANTRNMKLLQDHLEHPKQATRADTCFLFGLFFLVVVVPVMLVMGTIVAIVLGILAAFGKLG